MKRISINALAEQAVNLAEGASIGFFVTDENFVTFEHSIAHIRLANSHCLLLNKNCGGRPFVIDITIYCGDLLDISDQLDKYINGRSDSHGYVNVS